MQKIAIVEMGGGRYWTRPSDGKHLEIRNTMVELEIPTNNDAHEVKVKHLIPYVFAPGYFRVTLLRVIDAFTGAVEQINTLAPIKFDEFYITVNLPADLVPTYPDNTYPASGGGTIWANIEYTEELPTEAEMPWDPSGQVEADQVGRFPFIHYIADQEVEVGGTIPIRVCVEDQVAVDAITTLDVSADADGTYMTSLFLVNYSDGNIWQLVVLGNTPPPVPGTKYRIDLVATAKTGLKSRRSFHVTIKP